MPVVPIEAQFLHAADAMLRVEEEEDDDDAVGGIAEVAGDHGDAEEEDEVIDTFSIA